MDNRLGQCCRTASKTRVVPEYWYLAYLGGIKTGFGKALGRQMKQIIRFGLIDGLIDGDRISDLRKPVKPDHADSHAPTNDQCSLRDYASEPGQQCPNLYSQVNSPPSANQPSL